jgi:L-amino acid N-acyltransferase YncA
MEDVAIRQARESDAKGIAHVHVDSWRTTYKGIVPDAYLATLSYENREAVWQRNISRPTNGSTVFVAEDATGSIVGFSAGGPSRSGNEKYLGELHAIYLLDECQGLGIGRNLVAAVVERLWLTNLRSMLVWVLADNPSRAFYEHLGGIQIEELTVEIGGAPLVEIAYGWENIRTMRL